MLHYASGTPKNDAYQAIENQLCSHRLLSMYRDYQRDVFRWLKDVKSGVRTFDDWLAATRDAERRLEHRDHIARQVFAERGMRVEWPGYAAAMREASNRLPSDPPRKIMLDSGAFTAWNKPADKRVPVIRDALCELDRRGQKAGAGYYDYDAARRPVPSDITARVIREVAGVAPITMSAEEIVETCLFPMINESLRILEENKAQRPSDIDVVFLNGYGWPRDTGGPMYYGDMVGAPAVLARMETLAAEDPAFAPAGTLRDLVASGGRFTEIDMGGLRV